MLARINKHYVPAYWDDFFNDSFFRSYGTNNCNHGSAAVNVMEDEASYKIEVAVPGTSRNDFKIDLDNDILTISSDNKNEKSEENNRYMRREFNYSTFKRSFKLPESVDVDNIKANHENGILLIGLPKKEEVVQKAPKQIEIG